MIRRVLLPALAAGALGLALPGCESSNPVAPPPPGSESPAASGSFQITLAAQPTSVAAGSEEGSTVTVTVRRSADGEPPANGTSVAMNTDLGNFGTGADGEPLLLVALTLRDGSASATFFGGDDLGTANLLAKLGDSFGQLSVPVVEEVPPSFLVTAVSPNVGVPEGGEAAVVTGEGFVEPLTVRFASSLAQVVGVSPTLIDVITPPSVSAVEPGTALVVPVTVTIGLDATPESFTLEGAFSYAPDDPEAVFLLGVQPATGSAAGGDVVTITGGGFRQPLRVDFDGAVAELLAAGATALQVRTPPAPQPVDPGGQLAVSVNVNNGLDDDPQLVSLSGAFTYLAAPPPPGSEVTVFSIAPARGSYRGGTEVTIGGQGFVAPIAVTLGGVSQGDAAVDSLTQARFTTAGVGVSSCPDGGVVAVTGVSVTNLGTGASGDNSGLTFEYTVPEPQVSRVDPTGGSQLGNTQVFVDGSGFEEPARVLFVAGEETFSGAIDAVAEDRVTVTSPSLPDSAFPEVACQIDPETSGMRYTNLLVDLQVVNLDSGCADTFPNAFTYRPADPSCRPTPP